MNSSGDKKRKSGAVPDGTGSAQCAKHCKAPPAQVRQPDFLDLPTGVFAQVGKFFDVGTHRGRNSMMNFCIVVGPKKAKVVRQEYLENNLDYLMFILRCEENLALDIEYGIEDNDLNVAKTETRISNLRSSIQEWMRWNMWWKEAALRAFDSESASSIRVCKSGRPSLLEIIEVRKGTHFRFDPTCNTIVMDIDGIRGKAAEETSKVQHRNYQGNDEMETIQLMHKGFYKIFFNPALSVDLGLMDLLKFQMEELNLDVNSKSFTALFERLLGADQEWIPLLFHAFLQPDSSFFDFLWSQEELDVNPVVYENDGLLHWLSEPLRASCMDEWDWDMRRAERILQKVPDTNARDNEGHTPLDSIVVVFSERNGTCPHLVDLAMLYLSYGAKASGYRLYDMKALEKSIRDNTFGIREKLQKEGTLDYAVLHISQMLHLITEDM